MKHTKGPWKLGAYKHTNKCYVAVPDESDKSSSTIIYEEVTNDTGAVSPRARLIAAAPEMLEAMQAIQQLVVDKFKGCPELELFKRALRKAEGRDS